MRPKEFVYHRARDLDHALALLAEHGEEARPISGGQSLVPMMNLRLARPDHLVDVNDLGLDEIREEAGALHVGAMVRHERYLTDPLIRRHLPALLEAVHWIGHPTIRRNGTLGGSLCHADPTAELPAMAVLHGARIVLASTAGRREVAACDFFKGAYMTDVQPGEMLVSVIFPCPQGAHSGAFEELGERLGDFAMGSFGVVLEHEGGVIRRAATVCGGAKMTPIRLPEIEAALQGQTLAGLDAAALGDRVTGLIAPAGDFQVSAEYRRALIGELAGRALQRARDIALNAQP
ncbi:FAD binding domain-containing protein [Xinfangfangia pollutisoli]|uniref:FAD binding domain-containing protein n=1 Tax=Xinfangfangia pollutisoli TaxID=2865960 RepID=UPI001CD1C48A|nr:xanthine dehydrogenase family protein subunit M [Xinfangfangia pollutisoli]